MEKEIKVRKKRFAAFWTVVLMVCAMVLPTTVQADTYSIANLSVGSVLQPNDTISNEGNTIQVSYSTGSSEEGAEISIQSYGELQTGQAFDGWKITGITEEDHSGAIVTVLALEAQLSAARYTVTFDTNGGTAIDPITKAYGETIDVPSDPSKEGYKFTGWSVAFPYSVIGDITITANWEIEQYTITFDTDGGSAIDPITQDFNTAVTAPSNPTKEEYIFDGWDQEIPSIMPARDMTITAKWKSKYIIEKGTHELKAGVQYQLGSGVTRVDGDLSTYASGAYFYVPADGSYTFS